MGYYTSYSLDFYGDEKKIEKAKQDLIKIATWDNGEVEFGVEEVVETGFCEAKWYNHYDHLKVVAKLNPDILIILHGSGEEQDDIWEERYKGNEYECQQMTIPPFENPELQILKNN